MPRVKLTNRTVEAAKAPSSGRTELWDRALPGFGLRITEKGRKSWIAMYRLHGRQCRPTLGHYPSLSLAEARSKAREVLGQVENGVDPRAERRGAKSREAMSVKNGCEFYVERYAKRNKSSWKQDEQALKRDVIPAWGSRPLVSITDGDINDLLWSITDRGAPIVANRLLTLLKTVFGFLVTEKRMAANPATTVTRKTAEEERDRVLEDFELRLIWEALQDTAYPFGHWFTVRALSGQRRTETARMKWAQLDFERGRWTLPAAETKNDERHIIPLTLPVIDVLKSVRDIQSSMRWTKCEFVFSSNGRTPISGYSKADKALYQKANKVAADNGLNSLDPWTPHDWRRTFSTVMADNGPDGRRPDGEFIPPEAVEYILNHSSASKSGVRGVYNRHMYAGEKRRALEIWAGYLFDLGRPETANVTNIAEARHG